MSENVGGIHSEWTLDTSDLKRLKDLLGEGGKQTEGFLSKMSRLGNVITGIKSGIDLFRDFSRLLGGIIEDGIEFERTFGSAISLLNAGDVDKFSQSLRDLALQMGKETAFSAVEAAEGIKELLKAGLSAEQILGGGLKTALDLAAAGELNVSQAAATTAINLKVFKLEAEESSRVADLLAGAANSTTADVNEMSQALNQSGVVMGTLKVPIEDGVTLLGLLAENGLKGSDAGTSLKTALLRLAPVTDQSAEAYKKLGIEVFNANGEMKPMREVIGQLENGFKTLTDAEKIEYQTMIFGQDAIRASSLLIEGGVEAWDRLKGTISEFSAADVAAAKLDNLAGDIQVLEGSTGTLSVVITEVLVPGFRFATQWAIQVVNAITEWVQANKEWLATSIDKAIQSLIGWIKDLLKWVNDTVTEMGGWESVMKTVKDAIVDTWDKVSTAFSDAWTTIKPIFEALSDFFSDGGTWSAIATVMSEVWNTVMKPVLNLFVTGIEGIGTAIGTLSVTIPDKWNDIMDYLGNLKERVTAIFNGIVNAFRNPLSTITGLFNDMTDLFRSLFGQSLWPEWMEKLSKEAKKYFTDFNLAIEGNLKETAKDLKDFTSDLQSFTFDTLQTLQAWSDGTVKLLQDTGVLAGNAISPFLDSFGDDYFNFLQRVRELFGEDSVPDWLDDLYSPSSNPSGFGQAPTTVESPPSTVTPPGSVARIIKLPVPDDGPEGMPPGTIPKPLGPTPIVPDEPIVVIDPINIPDPFNPRIVDPVTGTPGGGGFGNPIFNIQTMDTIAALQAVVTNALRDIADGKAVAGVRG